MALHSSTVNGDVRYDTHYIASTRRLYTRRRRAAGIIIINNANIAHCNVISRSLLVNTLRDKLSVEDLVAPMYIKLHTKAFRPHSV